MLHGLQRLQAGFVEVVDLEALRIAGHDVDRHVVDHLQKTRARAVRLDLLGHHAPGHHRADVGALPVVDGGDQEVERLGPQLDRGRVRQVARIGDDPALMRRVLVEDVDAGADELVGLERQIIFEPGERLGRDLVEIGDLEVFRIAHHHAHRHALDHLVELRGLGLGLDLLGDHAPGHHGVCVGARLVVDRGDQEIEGLGPQLDPRRMRQVAGVGEDAALMRRVRVEDVEAGADEIVGVDIRGALQPPERVDRRLVGVDDAELLQLADHDVDRHAVDHPAEGGVAESAIPFCSPLHFP